MDALNLIWQTAPGDQTTFEFEYTTEVLFKNFTQNRIFDHGSLSTVLDNSVIIYSNNSGGPGNGYEEYLDKFKENNYKVYLLHFSNEDLNHDCKYYSKATHVFRNYYDPAITLPNVTFIPLGFKSGFYNSTLSKNSCTEKDYDFTFIGQPKADRDFLISEIEKAPSYFVHRTQRWNCDTAISQTDCSDLYKRTKYIPCPKGWVHPDSFRICETLEWGSVPVIKKYDGEDYFQHIFPNHPFPVVEEWNQIHSLPQEAAYCQLLEEVQQWYSDFKIELQDKIYETIQHGTISSIN